MKKIPFTQAQFVASAFNVESFPKLVDIKGSLLPEVALVGRSNVGKSSLINNLLKNKTLAKTSSTPGKTQSVNFYTVNDQLALVDLPGYGYAKPSKQIKKQWVPLIDAYLEESSQLKLILLLIDCRREFTKEDQAMIDWTLFRQLPFLLVFTKSDKLNVDDLAKKHEVSKDEMYNKIVDGIKEEMEHTDEINVAKEIAMDHLFQDLNYYDKLKKVEKGEFKEATSSASSGSYESPAFLAKSMDKKNWRGAAKPLYKGGKFVRVKKKCKTFPYCNQGDIKALDLWEDDLMKEAIKNVAKNKQVSENVVRAIVLHEIEKQLFGE